MLALIIGVLAILTGTFRLLPQIVKTHKTKRVGDISLGWEVLGILASLFWFWYGYLERDIILVIGTVVLFVEYSILLCQKIKYGRR